MTDSKRNTDEYRFPNPGEVNGQPVAAASLAFVTAQAWIARNPHRERIGLRVWDTGRDPPALVPDQEPKHEAAGPDDV